MLRLQAPRTSEISITIREVLAKLAIMGRVILHKRTLKFPILTTRISAIWTQLMWYQAIRQITTIMARIQGLVIEHPRREIAILVEDTTPAWWLQTVSYLIPQQLLSRLTQCTKKIKPSTYLITKRTKSKISWCNSRREPPAVVEKEWAPLLTQREIMALSVHNPKALLEPSFHSSLVARHKTTSFPLKGPPFTIRIRVTHNKTLTKILII